MLRSTLEPLVLIQSVLAAVTAALTAGITLFTDLGFGDVASVMAVVLAVSQMLGTLVGRMLVTPLSDPVDADGMALVRVDTLRYGESA